MSLSNLTFEGDEPVIALDAPAAEEVFSVDAQRRTITGLAVPFGKVAISRGRQWTFSAGSLEFDADQPGKVKLLVQHDASQAVGRATKIWETPAGMMATFSVARGPAGDHALSMAEDGVWDGLSVGLGNGGTFEERSGVYHAGKMPLAEVSLTPLPAYSDARVMQVTASAEGTDMPCPTCGQNHAPGTPCGAAPAADASTTAPDFSAISTAITEGFSALQGREILAPAGSLQVTEELPYRFDGTPGEHDFSSDIISALRDRNFEAKSRVEGFLKDVGPVFNVTTANVATVNPVRQRPDLYVDQQEYLYPMLNAIYKGRLGDITPFIFPKFATGTGLVADHVEGVEPTPGAFTTANQTVTPTALSGKVIINREVWDQGGNPQVSNLIWRQMVRAWFEGLEAYVQAQFVANAASITDIVLTTAATNSALDQSLTSQLATLQYIRGGNRFRDFFVQVDLYKALVAAVDSAGRRLYPAIGAQNALGTVANYFASLDINGLRAVPAWATAATSANSGSSWLFDREDVHLWASTPERITMDEVNVATVALGIWGYKAFAISDFNGVREVTYDPV